MLSEFAQRKPAMTEVDWYPPSAKKKVPAVVMIAPRAKNKAISTARVLSAQSNVFSRGDHTLDPGATCGARADVFGMPHDDDR